MITVNKQPEELTLVRNPVNYELQTDNYISTAGAKASCSILFTNNGNGGTITFTFLGKIIVLTSNPTPDDSGLQFDDYGATVNEFIAQFIENCKQNKNIADNYDVVIGFPVNKVDFIAKENGVKYNISVSTAIAGTSISNTAGINTIYRERFKILHDVYFESNYGGNIFNKIFSGSGIPNALNICSFNFSDVLRGALQFYIPHFAWTGVILNESVKRYYTRYCESFGFPAVTNAYKKTNLKYAFLGAQRFVEAAQETFTGLYKDGVWQLWLTSMPQNTIVAKEQNQYLSIFVKEFLLYNITIDLYYTDGTFTDGITTSVSFTATKIGVFTFAVGYDQLNIDTYKTVGKTVKKYTVYLWDAVADEARSNPHSFEVDNNNQLFVRNILFFNSFGMPETICFTGKQTNQVQSKNEVVRKADFGFDVENGIYEGETTEINNELQFGYELNSGWKTTEWVSYFNDFLNSRKRLVQATDKWVGINIPAQKIQLQEDDNTLFAVKFNYQDSFLEKGNA